MADQWMSDSSREDVISALAVVLLVSAVVFYVATWLGHHHRNQETFAVALVAVACLAQLGYAVWPITLAIIAFFLLCQVLPLIFEQRRTENFARLLRHLMLDYVFMLTIAPVYTLLAALNPSVQPVIRRTL